MAKKRMASVHPSDRDNHYASDDGAETDYRAPAPRGRRFVAIFIAARAARD